jgi:glycosyltransferase involved in cell wall biosynthesis
MFRRDVDYCSAAFLLTWRKLFLEGGGFDVVYVPAYYEETDYCVRLWKNNRRVVYDPDVAVLHYEFASSGSSRDAIELQTKNRKIFVTRHRDWLKAQQVSSPECSLTARFHQRNGAKRILFLDDRVPHVALGSGFPRSNLIISEMVKMGHIVTCYPVDFSEEHWQDVYRDIPREVEVMINHGLSGLERFLLERTDYFDIIFISRPHNMRIFKGLIERRTDLCKGAVIIYDAEAIFALREIERRRTIGKGPSVKDQGQLVEEEMRLAEPADRIVSVSDTESQEFRRFGFKNVHTLGHGIRVSPTPGGFARRSGLLFVGAVHTATSPNADSLLWFTNHILPLIQKKLGNDLPVVVAGTVHPDIRDHMLRNGIDVKGTVKDLTSLYNGARIFIAPTRFAAGIPHKIHEAAAHGLPVVTTSLLSSQLGWVNGWDLLAAEDAESFADACIRLNHDSDLWNRLRDSALSKVSSDCSPDIFSQQLRAILE